MGNWFQRTWEKTKEIAREIGDSAKRAIARVAEKIQDWATGSKKASTDYGKIIGDAPKYDSRDGEIVFDYAQKASDFMATMGPMADGLERQCIREFFRYYFDLLQHVENEDRVIIKSALKTHTAALQGGLKNYINDHISPSNPDFRRLVSDKKTGKLEIDRHQRTVMNNALDDFCEKIKDKIKIQNQQIKDHFHKKQAEQEIIAKATLHDYSELIISSKTGELRQNKDKIVGISSTIIRCDYILNNLQ